MLKKHFVVYHFLFCHILQQMAIYFACNCILTIHIIIHTAAQTAFKIKFAQCLVYLDLKA